MPLPTLATKRRVPSTVGPIALRVARIEDGNIRWERSIEAGRWWLDGAALESEGTGAPLLTIEGACISVTGGQGRIRRSQGDVEHASATTLALGDHARWTVAGCTLLLQAIERPAPRAQPGLPAALRRGGAIDERFTAIATASLLAHFAFVVALENFDPPYAAAAELSPRVVELMMDAPTPPPDAPPEPSMPDESAPEVAEVSEGHLATPTTPGPRGPGRPRPAPTGDEIARMVAESTSGLSGGVIAALGGVPGTTSSAGAILAGMDGVPSVTSGGPVLATRGGGGLVPTGDLGALALAGGDGTMRSEGPALEERGPVGVVHPSPVIDEPSPGWLDPRTVTAAIRSRTAAIRRCYERELRDRPTLEGSLDVAFTIEATGEITGARVSDDTMGSERLSRCVLDVVRGIRRFSTLPEGGAARFTYPLVFVPGS